MEPWTTPSRRLDAGLCLLWQARRYAYDLSCDQWDLAVEIDDLRGARLTTADLRWLVLKGFVEHAVEMTRHGDVSRRFRRNGRLKFAPSTCFVLTDAGDEFALRWSGTTVPSSSAVSGLPAEPDHNTPTINPRWDAIARVLWAGDHLIKQFKVVAQNQECVLATFEEEGWPVRIDDPLSPKDGIDPKLRLHDTINRLNRNQKRRLLHFQGDGAGRGVCWRWA